jgi:hypothetical protein
VNKYDDASVDASDSFARHVERRDLAIGKQRIGALNRFYAFRYGGRESYTFPNDDSGREDLEILLQHYALDNPLAMPRIIKMRAPWVQDASKLLAKVEAYPRKWKSETLGKLLRLTGAEWKLLRTRTIAPIDMTKDERRQDSQLRHRERMKVKRRQAGQKTRAEYLAGSLSQTKPWVADGISRRTWERRRAMTQVCSNKDKYEQSQLATARWAAESQRKVVAERRRSPTAVAKVHPISASFQLTALPASTDLSKSHEFLSRTEAEWLLGVAA